MKEIRKLDMQFRTKEDTEKMNLKMAAMIPCVLSAAKGGK